MYFLNVCLLVVVVGISVVVVGMVFCFEFGRSVMITTFGLSLSTSFLKFKKKHNLAPLLKIVLNGNQITNYLQRK